MTGGRFMAMDSPLEGSEIAVFGAPFDATSSFRPGSRFAPGEMRSHFAALEEYSPALGRSLRDRRICDMGDLAIAPSDVRGMQAAVAGAVNAVMDAGSRPLMIGGEHLVTLPAVRAIMDRMSGRRTGLGHMSGDPPDAGLAVVHLDAHSDLRDEYMGCRESHACVMRRVWEVVGDGRIRQFGIRSGDASEYVWNVGNRHVFQTADGLGGFGEMAEALGGVPVYLSIDLDVFDPSALPGTGTPEPGGITYNDFRAALPHLRRLNVAAADIVELSPHHDPSGASTILACKVLRELLLCM